MAERSSQRLTDRLGRVIAAVIRFSLDHRVVVAVVGLAAGGLAWTYAIRTLGINTDTADMISPELAWRQDFIAYREAFPARDRNLIVVVDGGPAQSVDDFATGLANRLRASPDLFRSVSLAGAGPFFERNGLLYLSLEELERLADRLAAAQPLLGRMQRRFGGVALIEALEEAERRGADSAALDTNLLYAPIAESVLAAAQGARKPVDWRGLLEDGDAAPVRRFVVVQPVERFDRMRPAAAAIEAVRDVIEEVRTPEAEEVRVRLTGTVAMEDEELGSVSRGALVAGLLSLALVAAVIYVVLRSARLLAIAVVTLIVGLGTTAAFAAATVGHLNLLSVAFAVLYIGLGVDYIIHYCMRLEELTGPDIDRDVALTGAAHDVGAALLVCAVTTAAGFYSFIPTPFSGVSELGLISGTGIFFSLLLTFTLLPALIRLFYVPQKRIVAQWIGARALQPVVARPRRALLGAALLIAAALASLPWVRFDSNPVHLRDPDTESVRTLLELAGDGEALPLHLVAVAPDADTARRWAERLEALPTVRSVATLDSLVPPNQAAKLEVLADMELFLGADFARLHRTAEGPQALRAALGRLAEHLMQAPQGTSGSALAGAIEQLFTGLDQRSPSAQAAMLLALEEDLIAGLPPLLQRLEQGLEARAFGREALPADLAARWLGPGGREIVEIAPRENIDDNTAAERFVTSVRQVVGTVTGLPVVHQEASRTVVRAFQQAFLSAFLVVTIIVWLFRFGLRDSLLVIVPVLIGAVLTAAFAVWLGIPFNFANIIALPLLLGIGVDNAIHVVRRVREAGARRVLETSTSRAVAASSVTTVASFGNLAFSPHLGMASMGQLLTIGMVAVLVSTLVFLPAVLRALERP
jgi:hopanoid biosynthesis associated RND transporter like protein HpnN